MRTIRNAFFEKLYLFEKIPIRKSSAVINGFVVPQIENENTFYRKEFHRKAVNCFLFRNSQKQALRSFSGERNNMDSVSTTHPITKEPTAKHINRLAQSKSPYLLQHQNNPVDWYPWGEEAIERARKENKIIFLSVGYSTCHWCHVMEHESFEDEKVAAFMNENFVNIKVDREERPDIDKIYMQFVLMINGQGGWPMSIFLTPDLKPIAGGTYYPPAERWGIPSFMTVLKTVATKWRQNEGDLKTTATNVIDAINQAVNERKEADPLESGQDTVETKLLETLNFFKHRFDELHGGFGLQPKFPEVSRLNFLFHVHLVTGDLHILKMALNTLQCIGRGGIRDHIFGGFSRYSVDREWHVPHFEKMLYDQGQLMVALGTAYQTSRKEGYLDCADDIFRYIMKDLRHPRGGFFAGEDADSLPSEDSKDKVEGAFYSWAWDEVKALIRGKGSKHYANMDEVRVFETYAFHYDLQPRGNVQRSSDPHGHLIGKNILIVRGSPEETCRKFNITKEQFDMIIKKTNALLHEHRCKRPRPHLDTKIICSWNSLVLSGLSKLSECAIKENEKYLQAAEDLYNFIHTELWDSEKKRLYRACYGFGTDNDELDCVERSVEGFLDDYAFLVRGLLDYYRATLKPEVLLWAKEVQDVQDNLFWDKENDAYFYSGDDAENIVVRMKDDHDGAEPCGSSMAARNLLFLSYYFDDKTYAERARKLFAFYSSEGAFGYNLPEMMSALLMEENGLDLVAVVGPDTEATKEFLKVCRKFYIPAMIAVHINPEEPEGSAYNQRLQEKFKMVQGKPTIYICRDKVCQLPITDMSSLQENLEEKYLFSKALES